MGKAQPVLYLARDVAVHDQCREDARRNGFEGCLVTSSALEAQAFLRASSQLPPLVFLVPSDSAIEDLIWWGELLKRELEPRGATATVIVV